MIAAAAQCLLQQLLFDWYSMFSKVDDVVLVIFYWCIETLQEYCTRCIESYVDVLEGSVEEINFGSIYCQSIKSSGSW